jgi:hypothetical protein
MENLKWRNEKERGNFDETLFLTKNHGKVREIMFLPKLLF